MSITSTSRFFHVSEVSVFCCLINSIRPEGCREYMHRSLSLGSGRDGSCGGANILENSQKNLKKWGKYFYSDGSNPHSARIRTHSQFKKFLQIHSYIRNMILQALLPHVNQNLPYILQMSRKIKGKVPDHDLSNLPKSDIHV